MTTAKISLIPYCPHCKISAEPFRCENCNVLVCKDCGFKLRPLKIDEYEEYIA